MLHSHHKTEKQLRHTVQHDWSEVLQEWVMVHLDISLIVVLYSPEMISIDWNTDTD